jgi:hypothetical protein
VISVAEPVASASEDYFPLSKGSYWSYEDLTLIKDTMMRSITDTVSAAGYVYSIMHQQTRRGGPNDLNFRKSGGLYFEYASVDKYTASLSYITPVIADIEFLNQVLFKGATWASEEYTSTIAGGQPIMLQYSYTCLDNDATVNINGNIFAHVYIISMLPFIRPLDHGYTSTGEQYFFYFAKGVGLIYMLKVQLGARQLEWQIKTWHIN